MAKKTASAKVVDPDIESLGPAMLALNETQRRWVIAYAMNGDATAAARAAGYSDVGEACKVRGFHNLRNQKVIDALQEWTRGALQGRGAFVAVQALIEIASDPEHKHRFDAADSLADRVGFARQTNHQVQVEHTDTRSTESLLEAVRTYFQPRQLPAIEAEVVDVPKED